VTASCRFAARNLWQARQIYSSSVAKFITCSATFSVKYRTYRKISRIGQEVALKVLGMKEDQNLMITKILIDFNCGCEGF
jgi:hypothetical protein